MKNKFELIYYFQHCRETHVYSGGSVETEEEAKRWVEQMEKENNNPENIDSICDCKADYCPIKHSKPVYSYRK